MTPAPLLAMAMAALAAAQHATTLPLAAITNAGGMTVTLPASVLQSKEVSSHLTSGLTTAFVILVNAGEKKGAARVTVRYELWDETYLVSALDSTGREVKHTFTSAAKMTEWWSTAPLLVIRRWSAADSAAKAQITVKVLPFSAREQAETQRWLSRIFTSMNSVKDAPVDKRSDAGAAKILDVIVSTSIQRRPILEYQWTVDARAER